MKLDKQTFTIDDFTLEVTPIIYKPDQEDFDDSEVKIGFECGADVHICYQRNPFREYEADTTLRILQCFRSEKHEIDNIIDEDTKIRIDHRKNDSVLLKAHLFGNPEVKINHADSEYIDLPTTSSESEVCNIYDIPREIYVYKNKQLKSIPIKIEFWDYAAGVNKQGYTYIKNDGIKWTIIVEQKFEGKMPLNDYNICVSCEKTQILNGFPYESLFKGMDNSYKIVA